jgi:hypothetical protein
MDLQVHFPRHDGPQNGQAPQAGLGQIERLPVAQRLTQVGQHLAADSRRLPGRPHGLGHALGGSRTFRQVQQGQLQVPHHRAQLVIERVGDGPGHAAQAFRLLELPVCRFQFFLVRFRLLAPGDVFDHSMPQDVSVFQSFG